MSTRGLWRMLAVLFAVALVGAACSDSDSDSSSDTTSESSDTTSSGDGSSSTTAGDTVETTQDGGRLDAVLAAGTLNCGVNDTLPGFGITDADGNYTGFDIDTCRAIAAALFDDPDAVTFTPLTAGERFTALQSGSIDVLIRNTTWTASRDGTEGATFLHTTFYDGQGMMVPADSPATTLEDLDGGTICVLSGTTTELNLTSRFNAGGIAFTPLTFESNDELQPAYLAGQCDAWTSDSSQLAAFNATMTEEGFESKILEEIFSKEPLGPVVADGDSQWAQVVDWVTLSLMQAEEFGLDSTNIATYSGDDPEVIRFVGAEDPTDGTVFDSGLGLEPDFAVRAVSAVGNYAELFERHLTPLGIQRGYNQLWTDGGLLYPPPYR
jgi:general L-amino acid transport system substrate-binding protein